MNQKELHRHLNEIIDLDESRHPIFSIYLRTDRPLEETLEELRERFLPMQRAATAEGRYQIASAYREALRFLKKELPELCNGLALFVRNGDKPWFKALTFSVPMPDLVFQDYVPHVFPLIELKDICDRYVVLITTEQQARIVEIALGGVTRERWMARPELRKRVGREWTREHYRNHRRDRTDRFLKEKIGLLEELMRQEGRCHLILAGQPRCVNRVRERLPTDLLPYLIDTAEVGLDDPHEEVVRGTIALFIEQEEADSVALLDQLKAAIHHGEKTALGSLATYQALRHGLVDTLFVARSPIDEESLRIRERIVQMAVEQGCHVETISEDSMLSNTEGIAALLRFNCDPAAYMTPNWTPGELAARRRRILRNSA